MPDEKRLQRLVDESDIRAIVARYARGVDRQDWGLLRSLYHDDALEDHGVYNGTADGYVQWLRENHSPHKIWMHVLADPIIDFTGDDEAYVEGYALAFCRFVDAGHPTDMSVRVRYCDRFERRDGVWKIAHRKVVYQPGRLDEVTEDMRLGPGRLLSAQDDTDPAYWGGRVGNAAAQPDSGLGARPEQV